MRKSSMNEKVTFRVFRGEPDEDGDPFGELVDYTVDLDEGMVVLDVVEVVLRSHVVVSSQSFGEPRRLGHDMRVGEY